MNKKQSLDELFKQQQKRQQQLLPSEEVWIRLESRLKQKHSKPKAFTLPWQLILAVAAVLLLLMLPVAYFQTIENKKNTLAQAKQDNSEPTYLVDTQTQVKSIDTIKITQNEVSAGASDNAVSKKNNTNKPSTPNIDSSKDKKTTVVASKPSPVKPVSKPSVAETTTSNSSENIAVAPQPPNMDTPVEKRKSRGGESTTAKMSSAPRPSAEVARSTISLNLEQGKAIDYINALKAMTNNSPVQVNAATNNFLTNSDLVLLMPLLDSIEPAAAVFRQGQKMPSQIVQSTVGNEAFWLVKTFKEQGTYPPKLSVKIDGQDKVQLYNTATAVQELRKWWQNR